MSSVAVMQAVTTRIGNLIGERNYELIPGAIVVNSLAAVCITSVVGCFLQAFRADIIPVYTSDGDIYREVYAASFSNYLGLPCYALTIRMLVGHARDYLGLGRGRPFGLRHQSRCEWAVLWECYFSRIVGNYDDRRLPSPRLAQLREVQAQG